MGFQASFMWDAFPGLVKYLPITLFLAVATMFFSILIGLALAIVRFNKTPVLNQLASVYISFFRGVPSLVMLFLIYFGLPQVIPAMKTLDAMGAAILGLSLKEASYLAEIFRAALTSVDRGQYEAGLASGMKPWRIYQHYILPQAAFNALPSTGNIFVGLIKETSIVFTLGITEMFASAQMIAANNFHYFEVYLMVGLIYWAVIALIGFLVSLLEKSIGRPYQR